MNSIVPYQKEKIDPIIGHNLMERIEIYYSKASRFFEQIAMF